MDIGRLNPSASTDILIANKKAGFGNVIPTNFTWHHIENTTQLELIPTDLHEAIQHTGGRATNKPK